MFRLLRLTRTFFLLVFIAVLAGAAACFVNAGRMLVDPHALETPHPADAIIVLSGTEADRWLEAYELWREGRAPLIVLSPGYRDSGATELERRGISFPSFAELARDTMVQRLGVPAASVEIFDDRLDNTAAEAEKTREAAAARGWRRVLVVTSLPHTRRTALAMRRLLEPQGVSVEVRASRYDAFRPTGWWRSRGSVRWVLTEFPKLMAYRLGLGE